MSFYFFLFFSNFFMVLIFSSNFFIMDKMYNMFLWIWIEFGYHYYLWVLFF